MAVIEGVGDEVTLLLGLLLVLVVLLLAWASTGTSEPEPVQSESGPEEDTPTSSPASPSGSAPTEASPPAAVGGDKPGEGLRNRGRDERNSLVLRLKFLNDTERTATQPVPGQTGQRGGAGPEQVVVAMNVGGLMVPLLVLMLLVLSAWWPSGVPPLRPDLRPDPDRTQTQKPYQNQTKPTRIQQNPTERSSHRYVRRADGPAQSGGLWSVPPLRTGPETRPRPDLDPETRPEPDQTHENPSERSCTATLAGLTVLLSLVAFGVYRR
ncbi:hypothetical protein WMY93_031667 [Mugilogobius chulae]|uniref:Uncharacterized protein n=1 Tax=Mugilogobius chulae TaxID=88201 RepID=A0AAW0MDT7_9GOBI